MATMEGLLIHVVTHEDKGDLVLINVFENLKLDAVVSDVVLPIPSGWLRDLGNQVTIEQMEKILVGVDIAGDNIMRE
jgi:hypothetical protein